MREGWGTRPESCPSKLGLLTPKLRIFCRMLCRRVHFQGSLTFQYFPLLIFGDLTPRIPVSQSKTRNQARVVTPILKFMRSFETRSDAETPKRAEVSTREHKRKRAKDHKRSQHCLSIKFGFLDLTGRRERGAFQDFSREFPQSDPSPQGGGLEIADRTSVDICLTMCKQEGLKQPGLAAPNF